MHALSFFKSLNALEKMCVIQKERRKKNEYGKDIFENTLRFFLE